MTETITIRGFVATYPTLKRLPNGTPVANFRLASTPRWYDQATQTYKEGQTNWLTLNSYRQLAHNATRSLQVGNPVIVSGRLKVRTWDRGDGSTGQSVEIDAHFMGHDLTLGTSGFQRNVHPQAPAAENTPEVENNPASQNQGETGGYYQQEAQQNPVQWGNEQGTLTPETSPNTSSEPQSDPVAEHQATYNYNDFDFVEETAEESEPAFA